MQEEAVKVYRTHHFIPPKAYVQPKPDVEEKIRRLENGLDLTTGQPLTEEDDKVLDIECL